MVAEVSDAARVRARGAFIEIAGGEFRLRFPWDALEQIEEQFGSCHAFEAALNQVLGGRGPVLKVVRAALTVGLEPPLLRAVLKEMLDQERRDGRLMPLVLAIRAAWLEAWGESEDVDPGKADGETADSPSPKSSTRSRSTSAGRRRSSGG